MNTESYSMYSHSKHLIAVVLLSLLLLSCDDKELQTTEEKPLANSISNTVDVKNSDTETYTQGTDYIALSKAYDTENNEQVVVYEFFSYACQHCFTFEPFINQWLETKPDYVKFVRVPLNFQPAWANFQKAYLTAEVMGIANETHTEMFEAIHRDRKRLNTMDDFASWYADTAGIDKDVFISTSNSFILDSKLRKADNMGLNMQITSTPTLVINGKYKAAKKIHGRGEIMKILDFVVMKEAESMGLIK